MRPKRAALSVGALVLAMLGGTYGAFQLRFRRAADAIDSLDTSLDRHPPREPFWPSQPGVFTDCATPPPHRELGPPDRDCSFYINAGGSEVPPSCRDMLEAGNPWVEEWLRCSQRAELGRRQRQPVPFARVSTGAGPWLAMHLWALTARQAVDECRLAMAHARDLVWTFGPAACGEAAHELIYPGSACGVALDGSGPEVRQSFLEDVRHVRAQLPDDQWLRQALEVEALRGHLDAQYQLPALKRQYDELIARNPTTQQMIDGEQVFNPGGSVMKMLEDCDQLRLGFDHFEQLGQLR
jgi:hypothetical protein